MAGRITLPVGFAIIGALAAGMPLSSPAAGREVSVTTYHNDTRRTGWNQFETSLTSSSVAGGTFTLQHSVTLDDQVDGQPLVVSNQQIVGQGEHTVVYVATENNTVYAIDGITGTVLLSRNLGTPYTLSPPCVDNEPHIGIASTPAISIENDSLYVVSNTVENGSPVYRLHALLLESLQDKTASSVVAASHTLSDGSSYVFNAAYSRQRAALLLSGPTVYVGFAAYCDRPLVSRGWLLGWDAQSLAPLASGELTDQSTVAPENRFLSSIWMSGYGPATGGANDPIFFVTGNSDPSGTTFNRTLNLAESLVKISPDLSAILGHFTPSDKSTLDQKDLDFGSGGAMLLPKQPGQTPDLVMAAGKDGNLYLLDSRRPGQLLGTYSIAGCFCGPSYFVGSDGIGRVVTSGGRAATVWRLNNSASAPTSLVQEHQTSVASGQDPGIFTSISSNGTQTGSAVIWTVGHPTNSNPANVTLYAIDPTTGSVPVFGGRRNLAHGRGKCQHRADRGERPSLCREQWRAGDFRFGQPAIRGGSDRHGQGASCNSCAQRRGLRPRAGGARDFRARAGGGRISPENRTAERGSLAGECDRPRPSSLFQLRDRRKCSRGGRHLCGRWRARGS